MKKYIITSLLALVHVVAVAADHCTNPGEYTIDRRCYVTDEQKTQKPYNAVVMVQGHGVCTGTIVKGEDDKPYLYTAKHCLGYTIKFNEEGEYAAPISTTIKLQDGSFVKAKPYSVGGGNMDEEKDDIARDENDWGVFKFKEEDEEKLKSIAVEKSTEKLDPDSYMFADINTRVVGYGTLKIMSDKEIKNLKKAYIKYLKENKISYSDGGIIDDAIYTENKYADKFLKEEDVFTDEENLKVSECLYGAYGGRGCQGWGGNSGGPVFDTANKIMAIVTKGGLYIAGGHNHATMIKGLKQSIKINDINLSPLPQPNKNATSVQQ